jgi:hypothetical protein
MGKILASWPVIPERPGLGKTALEFPGWIVKVYIATGFN